MLDIKYKGIANSLSFLAPIAFTRNNAYLIPFTTKVDFRTLIGALAGQIVGMSGSYEVDIFNGCGLPIGVLINNVATKFENKPSDASKKSPHLMSFGSYETDLFVNKGLTNSYIPGNPLYVTRVGLLTPDKPMTGYIEEIGVITKVPGGNPDHIEETVPNIDFLGFDLRL